MLSINHCSFTYPKAKQPTFSDFSLSFHEGGVYGLLGSNGVGKSTLLYLACGLLTPAAGDVTLNGVVTRLRRPETMAEIFIVPEEIYLPDMSLRRYVDTTAPLYPAFSMEQLVENLRLFGMDTDLHLKRLSMGQKKKVAMAFAMACNTKVLLMDEPTNGLDIPGKSAFRKFVASNVSDDRIFVISTHQVRDVGQILDHIVIINDRAVILNQPVSAIQSRLLFANTSSPELISKAIYAQKNMTGASVILPNGGDDETELDIELLFECATERPEILNSMFNPEKQ